MNFFGNLKILTVMLGFSFNLQSSGQLLKVKKIDSLKNKLYIAAHDTNRVLLQSDLATEYMSYNTDSAIKTGLQGINLAVKVGYSKGEALCRTVVSTGYSRQGNYPEAMEHTLKSLRIGDEIGDNRLIAMNYEMLGVLCSDQANDSLGLFYYKKGLAISRNCKYEDLTVALLNNVAQFYVGKKEYEKALDFYREELLLCTKLDDDYNISLIYVNVGSIYFEMGRFPESLEYLEKSIKLGEEMDDQRVIAASLMIKSRVLFKTGKPEEALKFGRTGLEIALLIKNVQFIKATSTILFDYFRINNDYRNALKFYLIGQTAIDSTLSEQRTKAFNNLVFRNENYYRQKEVEVLQKDRKLARLQSVIFLGCCFIIIIIVILVYRSRLKIAKINNILKNKNEEISIQTLQLKESNSSMEQKVEERTRELIAEREKSLRSILLGQQAERERIAKDLHDSLNIRMIGLKRKIEPNIPPLADDVLSEIDVIISQIREISHNLHPYALRNFGLIKAVEDLCASVEKPDSLKIQYSKINISSETRWDLVIETEIFRVLQELLANCIRHAKASNILVEMIADEKMMYLSVEDNGKGFDYELTSGKGIGLSNLIARVNLLGGTINYDSHPDKGTAVLINIPIKK